ncbi:hypothetical protein DKG77_07355 [Flagellimonas aquimarina]|uniref:VWFA domain-containing protein n=1 Tax=Flagellimonas aquimarina TaxID=2201895 RepID=A0A316KWZ7_9FLAO|nr:VWA domain-containing protein [Allomuricauda koreensis]PWL38101.1 hypothetical protein DKG77_07355 [Allomuricauda koreensis]
MDKNIIKVAMFLLCIALPLSCTKDEPLVLLQPDALVASTDFALKVELTWNAVSKAEGYNIYRADFNFALEDVVFSLIDKVKSIEAFTDLTVNSNSQYYYKIEAFNGDVISETSTEVIGQTRVISASEAFDVLAEFTGGTVYNANNAQEVPGAIIDIINDNAVTNTDLVFLIDNTSSMSDDIAQVKNSINNIIDQLPAGVRLGMAVYNDANSTTEWYNSIDLNTNYDHAIAFLNNIRVFGGGDAPESVYDGIFLTLNQMSWASESQRITIVIGDAPPLEGSRTVYSLKDVVDEANRLEIDVNLYPILIADF